MAAALRQNSAFSVRWLLNGYSLRPYQFTRTLCKVPSEGSSPADSSTGSKAENKLAEEEVSSAARQGKESSVEENEAKSREEKQERLEAVEGNKAASEGLGEAQEALEEGAKTDKRKATQQKLRNLLTSLASVDPIPTEPGVQLSRPKPRQKPPRGKKDEEPSQLPESQIDPELVAATKEVAESLGGDVQTTESELLSTLRLHSSDAPPPDKPPTRLSDLFVGMKVEKSPSETTAPVQQKGPDRMSDSQRQPGPPTRRRRTPSYAPGSPISRTVTRVDLLGAKPLGIFGERADKSSDPSFSALEVWEAAHQEELRHSISHPPENTFEEMIQWTNQGKLWTFPIDNEVGLESEKSIGFHEHVFLERHLADWCPKRGPIRHFMELVCTGLSKNPYLTVERKRAHIEWYRNYFSEKEQLLKDLGALEPSQQKVQSPV